MPNKGFVVAFGVGSADIGIYEYDKTGYKVGEIFWSKIVRSGNYFIETTKDRVYVILQTRPESEDRISRVKAIALELTQ